MVNALAVAATMVLPAAVQKVWRPILQAQVGVDRWTEHRTRRRADEAATYCLWPDAATSTLSIPCGFLRVHFDVF